MEHLVGIAKKQNENDVNQKQNFDFKFNDTPVKGIIQTENVFRRI